MEGYLFAGQGSQYVGMGKDLYQAFPESKVVFEKADKILGFSLSKLCFAGPAEELKQTRNCQPAILTMSIAAWEAFKKVTGSPSHQATGYVAGLSLGEYSALVAAEAMTFEEAVYLVRRRGEFMEEEAAKSPGKMLSIIGLDLNAVKEICQKTNTYVANINCPGQVVISGGINQTEQAGLLAKERGARMVITLETSGAFHSPLMQLASLKLAQELLKIRLLKPKIAVISNVTAQPAVSPEEIKDNLIKQIASSVLWEDSMRFALSQGLTNFREFGPGRVLKGLMSRIDKTAKVGNIEKKEDILSLKGAQDEA